MVNVFFCYSGEKSLPHNVGVLPSLAEDEAAWFSGILGIDDLVKVDPPRGQFLLRLQDLAAAKQNVLATFDENDENKDNEEEVRTLSAWTNLDFSN